MVCKTLKPEKDVDGITPGSLYGVFANESVGFPPCTAEACIRMLSFYDIPVDGKRVVVIGRSMVIGKPVSMMLQARDATVTMCHSPTRDLESMCSEADVLLVAIGKGKAIGLESVREGQIIIDVGINWDDVEQKLVGDVDFSAVKSMVAGITPVPGGIGAVTSATLVSHVVSAAERLTL